MTGTRKPIFIGLYENRSLVSGFRQLFAKEKGLARSRYVFMPKRKAHLNTGKVKYNPANGRLVLPDSKKLLRSGNIKAIKESFKALREQVLSHLESQMTDEELKELEKARNEASWILGD